MHFSNTYLWDLVDSRYWPDIQHRPWHIKTFSAYQLLGRLSDHEATALAKFYKENIAALTAIWNSPPAPEQKALRFAALSRPGFQLHQFLGHVIGMGANHYQEVVNTPSHLFTLAQLPYSDGFADMLQPVSHRVHLDGGFYSHRAAGLIATLEAPELQDGSLGNDTVRYTFLIRSLLCRFFTGNAPTITHDECQQAHAAQSHLHALDPNLQAHDYALFFDRYFALSQPFMEVNGAAPQFLITPRFMAVPYPLVVPPSYQAHTLDWLAANLPALIEPTATGVKITTPTGLELVGPTIAEAILTHSA
jgi:hypothetical protein